ncbi:MAG TPA: DUF4192 domain-containing protein [Actinomycetes bacterium]|nr:DUF4192 domain-containing protein [Actinomycetes bacterium]
MILSTRQDDESAGTRNGVHGLHMSLPLPIDGPSPDIPDVVDRPVLRASGPPEIVQLVPYLLGFHPRESLVMMAMRGRRIVVSVRYDLDAPIEIAEPWFRSASNAGADHAVALVYHDGITGPPLPMRDYVDQLGEQFAKHGLKEVDVIAVSDGRWWSYRCPSPKCCPPEGTPIDTAGAIAASAVSEGMVALPSRESLESELEIDELAMCVVEAEIDKYLCDELLKAVPDDGDAVDWPDAAQVQVAQRAMRATGWAEVRAFVKGARKGTKFTPPQAARVLVALMDRSVRDAAIGYLVGPPDDNVGDAWRQLARVAPVDLRAAPATLYALWCYAAGNGARSNIAIDVALEAEPDYAMAQILLDLMASGINPFEFIHDMATEAQRVGRRIQRRRDPLGRRTQSASQTAKGT